MEKDIREQIIDSARKIFAQFGYKKTTVDEIAQSIYKGKSSIYHYFKSKEEIFKGVIKKEYTFLKEKIAIALMNQNLPQEKLRTYILTRLNVLSGLSNFYATLKNDYFECLGLIEELRKRYIIEEIEAVERILQEGMDQGIFVTNNTKVLAHTIITVLKAMEYDWGMAEDKNELEKNVNNMLDMFFYGIVKQR
ncbi:MAG: TetR/AcrR family transcriptional regulator [Spirochaetales bacterium]|nr:TetR/AcrR family transcriptional regulator [Spirochaetales bacterium]